MKTESGRTGWVLASKYTDPDIFTSRGSFQGFKSEAGKEAILDILSDGDFVGKDSVVGRPSRTTSASAMTDCALLRIEKRAKLRALTMHIKLASMFWAYVLARNIRYQQDLVDQHCSSRIGRLFQLAVRHARNTGRGA
jgi:CRP-like cAMP-binding protein